MHGVPHLHGLLGNPKVGASWEGFVSEQVIQLVHPAEAFFWATHQGAEIDLLFMREGRRFGVVCKFSEAPTPNIPHVMRDNRLGIARQGQLDQVVVGFVRQFRPPGEIY